MRFLAHIIAALFLVVAPAWGLHWSFGVLVGFVSLLCIEIAHDAFDMRTALLLYRSTMWQTMALASMRRS
jgi:hypothetical protein